MKTFSLATRVDHVTKKYFVDKASALGITLSEYLVYHLEGSLSSEQKIEQLQAENRQLQQSLAEAHQEQAAKSKLQQQVERIMQQNDRILERCFQEKQTVLTKEQLQQMGFNFRFTTSIKSDESSNMVHTIYNYGYSLQEEQVSIYRMQARENL